MIGLLGISYHGSDLPVREKISREAELWRESVLFPHVLLSTCNRTEVYWAGQEDHRAEVLRLFASHAHYSLRGSAALIHLFRVTSGLDSAVLGETEIQRQVKLAYTRAGALPSALHFAFQKALKIGKEVRHQFRLGRETLQSAVWRVASEIEAPRSALLIGYSDINRSLLSLFSRKRLAVIDVCSRHLSGSERYLEQWDQYDLIVSATYSEGFLIAGECRTGKCPCVIDLSVPRTVDPALQGVRLWNIDQLTGRLNKGDHSLERVEQFVREQALFQRSIFRAKSGASLLEIYS